MTIDFKALQIKTSKIIASGSAASPKLLVYATGSAADDSGGLTHLSGTGSDAWVFVSGALNSTERIVLGGQTVVSGALLAMSGLSVGSATDPQEAIVAVMSDAPVGSEYSGHGIRLDYASSQMYNAPTFKTRRSRGSIASIQAVTGGDKIAIFDLQGATAPGVWSSSVLIEWLASSTPTSTFVPTNMLVSLGSPTSASNPVFAISGSGDLQVLSGSAFVTGSLFVIPKNSTGYPVLLIGPSGSVGTQGTYGNDVYAFISGNIATKPAVIPDYTKRGTTVIGGDLVVSGTLFGGSPLSIGSPVTMNSTLTVSGTTIFSGNVQITGTLSGGGAGGAPTDADYLVKTANGSLSAERVVTDTTSVTWDWSNATQAQALRAALTGDVTAPANSNTTTLAKLIAVWSTVSTTLTLGTGQPLSLTDATMTGKTAGGSVNGSGTAGIVASSFSSSAAETGTGSSQAGLGSAAASGQPYNSTDFPGQNGMICKLQRSDGDDCLLSDMLSTAILADRNAEVYAYLSYRSDLAADAKWRLWFYYKRNSDGLEVPFTPDTSLTNCRLQVPEVMTMSSASVSSFLGRPQFGSFAAEIGNNSVGYTQFVSSSATQRVIGRNTAGAGNFEEVTFTQLLDWVGSATRGDLLVRGASTWSRLALGSAGRLLVSSGSDPVWKLTPSQQLLYGTGQDGSLAFDGTSAVTINGSSVSPSSGIYTLTDDIDAQTITMSGTAQIKCAGYIVRCWGLVMGASNVIHDDGNAASGSTAGGALTTGGSMQRQSFPGNAGKGVGVNGSAGNAATSDSVGGAGGTGGAGDATSGGGSAAATAPVANRGRVFTGKNLVNAWMGGTTGASPNGYNGGAGGASGGGGTAGNSGGGGGGGGVCLVFAANVNATAGAVIRANGGNGGNAPGTNAGGGGGGGAGAAVLVCETAIVLPTVQANGGAAGAGTGTGVAGGAGGAGTTRIIQLAA